MVDPLCAYHYGNTTYPCSCPPKPTDAAVGRLAEALYDADTALLSAHGRRSDYERWATAILATEPMKDIVSYAAVWRAVPKMLFAIEEILSEYGLRTYDPDGIHRWRCEHPDRYGTCNCFDDMMQSIRDAVIAASLGDDDG